MASKMAAKSLKKDWQISDLQKMSSFKTRGPITQRCHEARKELRKPDKPQLANAITDYATKASLETHEATGDAQPKCLTLRPRWRFITPAAIMEGGRNLWLHCTIICRIHDSALSNGNGCF